MTDEYKIKVTASEAPALASRIGRVVADCFPDAKIEYNLREFFNKNYDDRVYGDVTIRSGDCLIVAAVMESEESSSAAIAVQHAGKSYCIKSATLINPSNSEIREFIVEAYVKSFKNHCLDR